ncbi:hypothetical protein H8790_07290 [Oscillibacter hominis]|uniref:Uncharacterized protein n=1 Tax=Oscillibacter hominis TaxID=2763056 RepID=A0A7G9B177_9FIRM|nr:hypothetical protein [Oscillibacter hominis]QNL43308.1 hypothetical protein H8790_07290 [Oscillibacter hominis]
MTHWKRWLLPVLSGIAVLASICLPEWASGLRDRELMGTVHAEAMDASQNLPVLPSTIQEKMELLYSSYGKMADEEIGTVEQELGNSAETEAWLRELADSMLEQLSNVHLLPQEAVEISEIDGVREVCRRMEDGASASFIRIWSYGKDGLYLFCVLDEETGLVLQAECNLPNLPQYDSYVFEAADRGLQYFLGMGLETELISEGGDTALFAVDGTEELVYFFTARIGYLSFGPAGHRGDFAVQRWPINTDTSVSAAIN